MTEDEVFEAIRLIAAERGLPAPASVDAVLEAENALGTPLPRLLRRLLLQVANGGFGPGRGILGVRGCAYVGDFQDIASVVEEFGVEPSGAVPPGVYPIYDWGCNMWTLTDLTDPDGAIWGLDQGAVFSDDINLVEWLARSLDGTLTEPRERDHPGAAHLP